jgi:hypothetical protein
MPTLVDAAKSSQNPFTVANFKAIATSDDLFSLLEFVPKDGESFSYTREKSLPSFGFIADSYAGTIAQSTGTDEKVTVPKRTAVSDFYVDAFDLNNQSGMISQMDRQTVKKFKAAGRTLADKFINGKNNGGFAIQAFQAGPYVDAVTTGPWLDTNRHGPGEIRYTHAGTFAAFRAPGDATFGPNVACAADGTYTLVSDNPSKWISVTLDVSDANADAIRRITFTSSTDEFDGLKYLISTGQTRASSGTNGDVATLGILDELIDSVKERTPGKMAFVMPSSLVRKYEAIGRAGIAQITNMRLPSGMGEAPWYKGAYLLRNDWITSDESKGSATNLSSIYLLNMAPEEGVWMGALGGGRFDVQADPRNASVLGFRLTELGAIQSGAGNTVGRRLAWYGAPAVGSDLSVARAKEIITAA